MGKYTANLNREGHTLSDKKVDCSPELAPCIETVKEIADELEEFVRFRIQRDRLTAEDIEALRQLLLVYPEDEKLIFTAAIGMMQYPQLCD